MFASNPDLLAARITLVALRAALHRPEDVTVPGVLLLPERAPLTLDQAAERLAAKAKPAVCVGFAALGCLAVGAWEITGIALQMHAQAARTERDWIDGRWSRDASGLVLIRGSTDPLMVPFLEFKKWYSQYDLPFVDRKVGPADIEAQSRGAIVTVSFSAPLGGVRTKRISGE